MRVTAARASPFTAHARQTPARQSPKSSRRGQSIRAHAVIPSAPTTAPNAKKNDRYTPLPNVPEDRVHWVDDDNLFLQMNDADGVAAALSRSFVKPASAPVDEDYDLLASLDGE